MGQVRERHSGDTAEGGYLPRNAGLPASATRLKSGKSRVKNQEWSLSR
jgi:hypothetical protein